MVFTLPCRTVRTARAWTPRLRKPQQRTWHIPLTLKFTSLRLLVHLYIQYRQLLHLLIGSFYAATMELSGERIMHPLLTGKGKMLKILILEKTISIHLLFEFTKDHFLLCMAFSIYKSFLSIFFKMIHIHLILVQLTFSMHVSVFEGLEITNSTKQEWLYIYIWGCMTRHAAKPQKEYLKAGWKKSLIVSC